MLWSKFGLVPAVLSLSRLLPAQASEPRPRVLEDHFSWPPLIPDDYINVQGAQSGLPDFIEALSTISTSIIPRTIYYSADKVPTDSFFMLMFLAVHNIINTL